MIKVIFVITRFTHSMRSYFFYSLFFILIYVGYGQQQFKGTVKDIDSELALEGVNIILLNSDGGYSTNGVITDANGRFSMENVPLGRQSFEVRYLGYKSKKLPELIINAGKVAVVEVFLEEDLEQLDEVVVQLYNSKSVSGMLNTMAVNSAQQFDVETIERFSGGRRDLARLARSYAGVLNTDDSRNDILVRGNSPSGVLWRLEGIPIPNPNHFAVAGTTGGPVSALNINLLKSSNFLRGAFPAEYGDVTSGVFDVNFRSGNFDTTEITAQIHATGGLELEIEGPLKKGSDKSYLVSYRYALTSLNIIPIGTNAIPNYQDLSFKLDLGKLAGGQVSLFGIGGASAIDFLSNETDEDDLFANPNEDLYNSSKLAIVGVNHKTYVSDRTYLKTTLAYTGSRNEVVQDNYLTTSETPVKYEALRLVDEKQNLLFSSVLNSKINPKLSLRSGLLFNRSSVISKVRNRNNLARNEIQDQDQDGLPDFRTVADFDGNFRDLQVFSQFKYRFSEQLNLHFGLHSRYFSLNKNQSLEPRGGISWSPNEIHRFSASFGKHTQTQQLPLLFYTNYNANTQRYNASNLGLDNSRSFHYIIAHNWNFHSNWTLKTELYYQALDKIAVEAIPSSYSSLNEGANFRFTRKGNLVNEGSGTNYGLEMTLERYFNKNYYLLFSASRFESSYIASDGIERNTAFNNRYVYNALGGKEFPFSLKNGTKFTFFVNTKFTGAGGGYYTPIDLAATIANNGNEVYDERNAFNARYSDYFRWDLKLGLRSQGRKKVSQEWSVDLLNLTNRENLFIRRFNETNNQINDVNQLGFFLDILYKIQF